MICRKCGREIRDDSVFCPYCGTVCGSAPGRGLPEGAAPYGAPTYTGPEAPVPGGKKKTGLLIGGAVAAAAAVALIVAAVSGLFSSPKGQVEKALAGTYAAYASAEKALGMPDISQWQKDRSIYQSMTLGLNSVNSQLVGYDMSALSGLEIGMATGYSGEDRYMNAEIGASWGADELILFRMVADDDELYLHSPQLAGRTYYGVNTETLGADLAALTGDGSVEDISFNFFDLMETFLDKVDQEAMKQAAKEANKDLWEAVTVKKEGAKTLDLNGTQTKTAAYQVTIPQQALEKYVDAMLQASAVDYVSLYRELFQGMGLPEEALEGFLEELEDIDPYSDLSEAVKDALRELGDVELEVCVSGGCVSAVLYEGEIRGSDVELALYLGGNGAYVDDLSAGLKVDSTEITVKSTGDHGLKGGVYTDETTVRVRQSGANVARVTSELSYDPKQDRDNFRWELGVDGSGLSLFGLETQGDLSAKEDMVDLTLEDVTCKAMGMEVCTLGFHCGIGRCPDGLEQPMDSAKLVTEMNVLELMLLANELESSAETWASDMEDLFAARLPAELYYALF